MINVPYYGVFAHEDQQKMWLKNKIKCSNFHDNFAKLLRGKLE